MSIENLKSKYQVTETNSKILINTKTSIYEYDKESHQVDAETMSIDSLYDYVSAIETGTKVRRLSPEYTPKIDPKTTPSDLNIEIACERRNVLLFFAESISAEVECSRCSKRDSISSSDGEVSCKKCRSRISISYCPAVDAHYLGNVSFDNCRLVVFNTCKFVFACECSAYFEAKSDNMRVSCRCGKMLVLRVIFVRLKAAKAGDLPGKGTCKHYKKSFRWFRFPCCNNLYPCDLCHDEEQKHVAETAKRMVCGLCKKEQSVKSNCECGMDLKSKKTAFWEGGKGNRDKTTMSRKDRKKYKK